MRRTGRLVVVIPTGGIRQAQHPAGRQAARDLLVDPRVGEQQDLFVPGVERLPSSYPRDSSWLRLSAMPGENCRRASESQMLAGRQPPGGPPRSKRNAEHDPASGSQAVEDQDLEVEAFTGPLLFIVGVHAQRPAEGAMMRVALPPPTGSRPWTHWLMLMMAWSIRVFGTKTTSCSWSRSDSASLQNWGRASITQSAASSGPGQHESTLLSQLVLLSKPPARASA